MKLFLNLKTFFAGLLLVVLMLFPAGCTQESEMPPEDMVFTIVHTNDLHGRVSGGADEEIGLALIAEKVEELRQQGERILLLDAGDSFHGTAYAVLHRGESVVALMNAMGYDAMVPGNHDFNYGTDRLMELEEIAEFPLIAANVRTNDETLFPPYVIIETGEFRVAVFGLVTQETMFKNHPDNVLGLYFDDPIETARSVVEDLKVEDVQMVIALTHLGYWEEDDAVSSNQLAASVDGIDLIIDGHSHHFFPDGLVVNNTVIVQAGYNSRALGLVRITSRGGELVEITPSLLTVEQIDLHNGYAPVAEVITNYEKLSEPILNEVIASSDVDLIGERELVRTRSTNLGQLINAAMLEASKADVAMINGGAIRSSIDSGPITRGDMLSVFPFDNYVVVLEVSGEDLIAMLEIGLSEYPEPSGAYPHTTGIEYIFDAEEEPGNRTSDWKVGGHPLEPQGYYRLVTNDFIAAGGDRYDIFKNKNTMAEYGNLDELLTNYLAAMVNIDSDFSD
ncbi:bifunctional metallophosphatase/5'-nucleotidase [Candidatus Contubernalis alkaliaceticus]|uniref:bifunctional metallophosphatase/5'-nucleotidase n=1 Tax=Candidatus Contubernalis alkaliaceticus TaxID=338645 RepID=UPI001F4BF649|nr:5'-nucleotidase C-terminal domain-containing protein [Candidatus Contubernalis alkalaceticus]UNC92276.1 5'-nucleotidase C-terminal domain-containing protein [Candidatus Contubernalis alkalaceticus]